MISSNDQRKYPNQIPSWHDPNGLRPIAESMLMVVWLRRWESYSWPLQRKLENLHIKQCYVNDFTCHIKQIIKVSSDQYLHSMRWSPQGHIDMQVNTLLGIMRFA
jgi:hypothetical protein